LAKSGFVVGGIAGATAIILLFAFILIPSQEIGTPDLITSNGHDATTLGDVLSSPKSNLTLVELFEKSEESVVKSRLKELALEQILVVWALVSFMII